VSLIDLPTAKAHLLVEADYPDAQVAGYLSAAERAVAEFLNRRIYAAQDALDAAIADVPASVSAASSAYKAALEAAAQIEDATAQEMATEHAERAFSAAKAAARETYDGIVMNDAIKVGILIVLAHLSEEREGGAASALEIGSTAHQMLVPHRVGWGA
jgi:Phage gp6-like head-tail connector protein